MAKKRFLKSFLKTRYFGLVIGLLVFLIILGISLGTVLIDNIEQKVLDFDFRLKSAVTSTRVQVGVSEVQRNAKISPDIVIVGIDDKSLSRFGKWPFPRYRHADLINSFSRIKKQTERERALFLDIYFVEPDRAAENDARLVQAIKESGRVYMETVLQNEENNPEVADDLFARQEALIARLGSIDNIRGDWLKVSTFLGVQPPFLPYGSAARGYGHPNFLSDPDQVYRRQPLVAKLSRLEREIPLDTLTIDEPMNRAGFEHLVWLDKDNQTHEVPYPLTPAVLGALKKQMERSAPAKAEDTNGDNTADRSYYVVGKYKDTFIPSITLSLALEYMHKTFSDVQVVLGEYIRIPSPEKFNPQTGHWEPYSVPITPPVMDEDGNVTKPGTFRTVPEVVIPIDETGAMLINFMGAPSTANQDGHQTFPVRSYAAYAGSPPPADPDKWPATKAVGNKILMTGIFAQGLAEDEKPTPFGLMYGVEIHATALNTILMGTFLNHAEEWVTLLILFVMIMGTAFMVSRLSTIGSLVATLGIVLVYFFAVILIFDYSDYILTLSSPTIGSILCFIAVVAYRTMTEEREKRKIRDTFSMYVSPDVVKDIVGSDTLPELGGQDMEISVLFSDIRGFTNLSEQMAAQELVNHLNIYLAAMTDTLTLYRGTLDKYVGDMVMGFWGAPLLQPDHALLSCKCALRMMEILGDLNKGWPPERQINIGIGINTGIMTVGNMGSPMRMNYTAMGDNVNLGSRLEGVTKQYYDPDHSPHFSKIIISEYTYEHVKEKVVARELDDIKVKGKSRPVLIYELIDVKDGLAAPVPPEVKGRGR